MDAADAVHELRHAQVDDGAGERQRVAALEAVLAAHQLQHPVDGERGGLVEVLVEAEREPGLGRPRDRARELERRRGASSVSCDALGRALDR